MFTDRMTMVRQQCAGARVAVAQAVRDLNAIAEDTAAEGFEGQATVGDICTVACVAGQLDIAILALDAAMREPGEALVEDADPARATLNKSVICRMG